MSRIRSHLSYANVVATGALFVALGGTSYAVTQLPRNSVTAKQIRSAAVGPSELRTGAVRSKAIKDRAVALRDISVGARSSLRGQTGPQGPPGSPGAPAATLSAAVLEAGRFARGAGTAGQGATHTNPGLYKVDFNRNVTDCYVAATIATTRGNAAGGEIVSEIGAGPADSNSVYVRTGDSNGAALDLPFHLIVSC